MSPEKVRKMIYLNIDIGPEQIPITKECIEKMISLKPRRMKLALEWRDSLKAPNDDFPNWRMLLPFCETLQNVFCSMCPSVYCYFKEVKDSRCFTFLNDAKDDETILKEVRDWLSVIGMYVAIRDCLSLSFAIDYDREGGNPGRPQTRIGLLRSRGKPYDGQATADTYEAAGGLVDACLDFIKNVNCYQTADVVVAMPPSDPRKPFNLPAYISAGIAKALGKPDLTGNIITCSPRMGLKEVPIENKFETLEGTIEVKDASLFNEKVVLLIDDLYQSGVSMNYAAMVILNSGAKKIFGLACEKTCRNDDNVSRR